MANRTQGKELVTRFGKETYGVAIYTPNMYTHPISAVHLEWTNEFLDNHIPQTVVNEASAFLDATLDESDRSVYTRADAIRDGIMIYDETVISGTVTDPVTQTAVDRYFKLLAKPVIRMDGKRNVEVDFIDVTESELRKRLSASEAEKQRIEIAYLANAQALATSEADNHRLKEQAQDVEEFISTESHDLKHPLSILLPTTRFIQNCLTSGNVDAAMKHLDTSLRVIREATNGIETRERRLREPQEVILEVKPVKDFLEVIKQNEIITELVETNGVKLEIVEPSEQMKIMIDEEALLPVVENLVINAIHATEGREDRAITIYTQQYGDMCLIHTKDTGSGMPKELWEKVFERFFSTKRNTHQKGSGLGLAVARSIVAKMRGHLWISESIINQGTTFSIALPLKQEASQPTTSQA